MKSLALTLAVAIGTLAVGSAPAQQKPKAQKAPAPAEEAPLTLPIQRLTVDATVKMAQATLAACRKEGYNIAVTIVDRGGNPQVVLRDTLAPDLTLTISRQKAYTAMSFAAPTSTLGQRFREPHSVGKVEGIVFSAGGLPIEAGGMLLGGIGVSGAPAGDIDERCANAGLGELRSELEMAF